MARWATEVWRRLMRGMVVRYLITGSLLFLIDLAIFLTLKQIGASTPVAQLTSRSAGAIVGFFGHKVFSFRNRDRGKDRLVFQGTGYVGLTVFNVLLSPVVVSMFEWLLPHRLIIVKVLAEVVMVVETYFVLKWLFRNRLQAEEIAE